MKVQAEPTQSLINVELTSCGEAKWDVSSDTVPTLFLTGGFDEMGWTLGVSG